MLRILRHILALGAVLALVACTRDPGTPATRADVLPPLFPDYTEVTIPANIAPLNFAIPGATAIKATFTPSGTGANAAGTDDGTTGPGIGAMGAAASLTVIGEDHIDIDADDWRALLSAARGGSITVSVSAWDAEHPEGVAYHSYNIYVREEIDPWLVYRIIDPGYDSWGHIGIYQRCLSTFDEEALITNADNRARCINCHSFADYRPETMMYHQRSVDPATVILHDGVVDRVDLKALGGKPGLYCKWHPSGRYIIFSTNGTHQSFLDHGRKVLEVYDTHSSLFLYDVERRAVITDSLLAADGSMQTFATWSHDGRWLYYCAAPQQDDFPADYKKVRYSIVRMGFDPATARFDGRADTVYNARLEHHSAAFPRLSPDGRYLLFTEAECGTFPVYHPEASLQILDLKSRETGSSTSSPSGYRRVDTEVLRSSQSESYHDWSSSGRWMVFQSRRMDGRHTRLMLAYFSPEGRPAKPFMLPQRDPEDNRTRIWSYNVPEFVKAKVRQVER